MAKLGVTCIIRRRYQRVGKPCWRNLQRLYSKISNESREALKRKSQVKSDDVLKSVVGENKRETPQIIEAFIIHKSQVASF
ncbi:hypothetical protein PAAG_11769 [Paracoccidioides lutzii Pb01]|uniref:Uncharacterized protein n=1 Tax=Paracoccidioides lutzii (strain ATCC MYA-826 / Pb01) TaxID=502779 RepID=A0A0A2V595_PARBA|nr:hypothetical protein PAAG_11769 [Paracoccidioides lutzii Pb01]KGQ01532.1 hypothetical protein PAAG_11769 [Paracoccidioides lutzii Pb01]